MQSDLNHFGIYRRIPVDGTLCRLQTPAPAQLSGLQCSMCVLRFPNSGSLATHVKFKHAGQQAPAEAPAGQAPHAPEAETPDMFRWIRTRLWRAVTEAPAEEMPADEPSVCEPDGRCGAQKRRRLVNDEKQELYQAWLDAGRPHEEDFCTESRISRTVFRRIKKAGQEGTLGSAPAGKKALRIVAWHKNLPFHEDYICICLFLAA